MGWEKHVLMALGRQLGHEMDRGKRTTNAEGESVVAWFGLIVVLGLFGWFLYLCAVKLHYL